ncbi:MAG: hypothetical protein WAK33_00075, partial [Silvibacterium sp.]
DCQRSTPVYRLSGPLWIGNRSIAAALELVALHFCANFSRLSKIAGQVKQKSNRFSLHSLATPNFERSFFTQLLAAEGRLYACIQT